jgi:hypothetical protein
MPPTRFVAIDATSIATATNVASLDVRFCPKTDMGATQTDVCFVPIADIVVVSTYRADPASEVFYKPTPYWPVCSRIFLRACKTACGGDIENFRTSKKLVAMI